MALRIYATTRTATYQVEDGGRHSYFVTSSLVLRSLAMLASNRV